MKRRPFSLPNILKVTSTAVALCGFILTQGLAQESPIQMGPPRSMKLPEIQHYKLDNGLDIVLMENHKVPLVVVELVVNGGSALDPGDKMGLSSLTADMMEEGAGDRNSLEYADAVDFLGASISAYSGIHTSGVNLLTPVSKLDSAMALFADMVLRPRFPESELERLRKERLTTLIQWHDEPRAIASVLFNRTIFGPDHSYGKISMGDEKSIRGIQVDDLREFHRSIYSPANASVIVVGDVSPELIRNKIELCFSGWQGEEPRIPATPEASQVRGRRIYLVDKPGAAQSEIRIGRVGVPRLTPDYFQIIVMNNILGGAFTSRLNQNLREKNGYTYGAYSGFGFRMSAGPFIASAAVQTDVTDKALTEFMNELNAILEPVSDEELERARNYLALLYPTNFETMAQMAGQLAGLIAYGLPDSYFNEYVGNVLAVTTDEVTRVAREYIDPSNIDIIIVGDREKIEAGLTALSLGEIIHYSIDDVLGPVPELNTGQ